MASQAVRLAAPSPRARTAHGRRRTQVARAQRARRSAATMPRAIRTASWDLRIFGLAIAAIAFAFVLAVLYVSQSTALSVAGYEVQKLAAQRDELRRQNQLLEIQGTKLDSPARIAAEAARLGLVRTSYVPVIPAQPLTAKR